MYNLMTLCDFYKLGHIALDPPGVKRTVSTWTPRYNKHDVEGNHFTVHFGAQYVVQKLDKIAADFFEHDFDIHKQDFLYVVGSAFPKDYLDKITSAFEALHDLGHLPIQVMSLPEGTLVHPGTPVVMMFNTHPDFSWLPQFLEDVWSLHSWLPSTSATTAYYRRKDAESYFAHCPDQLKHLCGDFSMRGMTGIESAAASGAGHLLSFDRTATVESLRFIKECYQGFQLDAKYIDDTYAMGCPSLEHSVIEKGVAYFQHKMLAGELDDKYKPYVDAAIEKDLSVRLVAEMCFMIYLLTEVQPTGALSYVSDTYDFWGVVSQVLPIIKDVIINRNGCLIIRPDSGDPVKILLGDNDEEDDERKRKGLVSVLWRIFGQETDGTDNIVLNRHIRVIYGDAITAERQKAILRGLERKGFCPTNIALGIGAYTYQYATRDTRGYAIKAVNCTIDGIGEIPIFKSPKTDSNKASQRGAVIVKVHENVAHSWTDGHTLDDARLDQQQALRTIYVNGEYKNFEDFSTIRNRLWNNEF